MRAHRFARFACLCCPALHCRKLLSAKQRLPPGERRRKRCETRSLLTCVRACVRPHGAGGIAQVHAQISHSPVHLPSPPTMNRTAVQTERQQQLDKAEEAKRWIKAQKRQRMLERRKRLVIQRNVRCVVVVGPCGTPAFFVKCSCFDLLAGSSVCVRVGVCRPCTSRPPSSPAISTLTL